MTVLTTLSRLSRHSGRPLRARMSEGVGGPARLRVIGLLAAVLTLQSADSAAVGAAAVPIEAGLHLDNTQLGLLVTVSTGIGAIATLPCGLLVDRFNRVRLLSTAVVVWACALVASGAAQSFPMLLITRLALGFAIAMAGPAIASLVGDLFPARDRGRLYGFILAGELVGAGMGFLLCGNVASAISWRWAFWVMVAPSLVVAWALHRFLPEPARGGMSQLAAGAREIVAAESVGADDDTSPEPEPPPRQSGLLEKEIDGAEVEPVRSHVLVRDAAGESLWWAVRYVLSIRTNLVLIVSSALGYFVFSGVRTFGLIFVRARFGLDQHIASLLLVVMGAGAVLGVLTSGRAADGLIARGRVSARPVVAGLLFLMAAVLYVPALLTTSLLLAAPLFFLAAAAIGGTNPPLDASRLDIVPGRLWGRAEAVRTVLRSSLEALAPLTTGWLSLQFGERTSGFGHPVSGGGGNGSGLQYAFLLMLIPVAASGVMLVLRARRTYPRDVATALASDRVAADQPIGRDR